MPKLRLIAPALLAALLMPTVSLAAEHFHLPKDLSIVWVIPFVCMLLSIALGPLTVPHFWEHHFGKVAGFWGFAFLIPCAIVFGFGNALFLALDSILLEYLPFILLLVALFTVAGGIRLKGSLVGTPVVNTGILALGTVIASWMGTTGAAMLLIRPLLRANKHHKYRVHQVVFFIFLVANIGGSLSPLGDPPLFLGFLKGVSFFWTTTHVFLLTVIASLILLALYFALDTVLFAKEGKPVPPEDNSGEKLGFEGKINFVFLLCIVINTLMSGQWEGPKFHIYGVEMETQNVTRDLLYIVIAFLSWTFTDKGARIRNSFTWGPILEVAKLFIGIFLSMIPAISILRAGHEGALASLVNLTQDAAGNPINAMFFWMTGALSSFLDNAPTYLVFFNTAGGDAATLMTTGAATLTAISAGAVFMGANTYIGNAPNFMVKAISEEQGVKMPSFFGYMMWSVGILCPVFLLLTFLFFI
ncbi:MAG: sodium:proton antiporter [Mailhella sp.]|nr:sodium:proton antiporter [Mailhella sp.]